MPLGVCTVVAKSIRLMSIFTFYIF